MKLTEDQIVGKVLSYGNKSVIITGGEPTIQHHLGTLVCALKNVGMWVALETNGIHAPSCRDMFDYISVSPKSHYFSRYLDNAMLHKANEVRIVAVTDEIVAFCKNMRSRIEAENYYISPVDKDGRIHYRRALRLLVKVNRIMADVMPPWCLSIQMHKIIGVR